MNWDTFEKIVLIFGMLVVWFGIGNILFSWVADVQISLEGGYLLAEFDMSKVHIMIIGNMIVGFNATLGILLLFNKINKKGK